tara:strand:+ start:661 stop:903 length:243 start_codon:yes stop_codon:yes gene_type:complete
MAKSDNQSEDRQMNNQPTAKAIKERLWLAMQGVQEGKMSNDTGKTLARQAMAIVSVVKVELEIRKHMVMPVSAATAAFVE